MIAPRVTAADCQTMSAEKDNQEHARHEVESLSLEDLIRYAIALSSSRSTIRAVDHAALTSRLSKAGISSRLRHVVASSLLATAPSPASLDLTRRLVGPWLPSGTLVLEMVTHRYASPRSLDDLPASDVINAACLGFYKMNTNGLLASEVWEFFDDIAEAYDCRALSVLSAPVHYKMWWTREGAPGTLSELCRTLKDLSLGCSGECCAAATRYVLQTGNGPLDSKISYFHNVLGEERSQLFSALLPDMGPDSALVAAEHV